MGKISYSQIANMISFYLFRYPSIQVALECVIDDIDTGENPELCTNLSETLERINGGEDEVEVLLSLANKVGSKPFEDFVLKVKEGKEKNKDLGFFVKGIDPVEYMKNKPPYKKKDKGKKHYKK